MEVKKTSAANLENKRNIFFEIGLTIAVALVFLAFEWKTPTGDGSNFITVSSDPIEEDMIPITQMTQTPPPPPMIKLPFINAIEIVEEDLVADELFDITEDTIPQQTADKGINISGMENYGPEADASEDAILPFVQWEDMPTFPGNVQQWIAQHVRYPEISKENGVMGKVYIQFVVERNGSVSNVKVLRGVDASLDKEAIRVIESMPKWNPGKQRGKTVRVSYTLPISFQLSNY